MSELAKCWDNDQRRYPSVVYVETTNFCNARCPCCLHRKNVREMGVMDLDTFKIVADKVLQRQVKIGAMFCCGEPLLDSSLCEKYAYGKKIGVFKKYVGLNTNVSLLTPEKWDNILENIDAIILSFFNVGDKFKRLTGGLNFDQCYKNAIGFINHRDKVRPSFRIKIGTNRVQGSDIGAVKQAFKGFRVEWAVDAELRWDGPVITGVVDRCIMYNNWRCDGHKGALQVKWNGNCEFCAYDIIKGETHFANILEDGWDEIERKFKASWREPNSLCKRCDYYHLFDRVAARGFKYVEDYSWQKPFTNKQIR